MQIRVRMLGGPLDGQVARVETLDECRLFFEERQRQVFCYLRENETLYVYDPRKSQELSAIYDTVKERMNPRISAVDFEEKQS